MRHDRQRLQDILDAARLIQEFASNRTKSDLERDALFQSGVLHQLYLIGEATNRLSESLKNKFPQVPWSSIYGFRNRIAHEYFRLDMDVVWQTISVDIPELALGVAGIVEAEFPSQGTS